MSALGSMAAWPRLQHESGHRLLNIPFEVDGSTTFYVPD